MTAVDKAAPKKATIRKKTPAKKPAAVKKRVAKKVDVPVEFHKLSVEDRFRQSFHSLFDQLEANYDCLGVTPVRFFNNNLDTHYGGKKLHLYLTEQQTERLIYVGNYGNGRMGSNIKTGVYKLHTPTVLYCITYASRNNWLDLTDVQFSITLMNSKNRPLINVLPHVYYSRSICLGSVPLMGFPNKSFGKKELYTRMNPESLLEGTMHCLNLYWSQSFKYAVDNLTTTHLKKIKTAIKNDSPKNLMQVFTKCLGDEPINWDGFPTVSGPKFSMSVPDGPETRISVPVKGSFKRARADLDQLQL